MYIRQFVVSIFILTITGNRAKCQTNADTGWTTVKIVNGTSEYNLFNIQFHYTKDQDTSWAFAYFNRYNEFLRPQATSTHQINDKELNVRYYTYEFKHKGKIIHKRIDSSFVLTGNRNKTVVLSDISVPPEWWESGWFITVVILFTFIFLWLLIKYFYSIKLKARNIALEKVLAVQNERMRISTEMHDDIGAGLMGITLQTEILKNKITEPGVLDDLVTIHASVSQISTKVREVIWSLNTENDTFSNLISFIHQQAHRMFENSETKLTIVSPEELPSFTISGDKRRHIFLIVREALHNILKHAEATNAKINFMYKDVTLQVVVQDNGRGLAQSVKSHDSMGLRSVVSRVQKLNGKYEISSSTNGTRFEISIPLEA